MELFLSIVNYVFLLLALCFWLRRWDIVRLLSVGAAGFFMFYVIISTCLFAADIFSITRALMVELILSAALLVIAYVRYRRDLQRQGSALQDGCICVEGVSFISSWPCYLLIAVLLVATQGTFGYYGMGQDQGVYQTEAINLYYNHNHWRESIHDFDNVASDEYRDYCIETVEDALGFDVITDDSLAHQSRLVAVAGLRPDGDLDGFWHGIPSYAALLALWARIFGIGRMMEIGAVFYGLMLLFLCFSLEEMQTDRRLAFLLVLLLGICPQLIWQKKASLTEGFTALLVMVYLFCLVQGEYDPAVRRGYSGLVHWSVLPVAAFSFFHVSVYAILPVFLVNYWLLYWLTGEKAYIRNAVEAVAAYLAGFLMTVHIQPRYVILNYYLPLRIIPMNGIVWLAVVCSALAVLISFMLPVRNTRSLGRAAEGPTAADKSRTSRKVDGAVFPAEELCRTARISRIFSRIYQAGVLVAVFSFLYQLLFRHVVPTQQTIYCYMILSGIVVLPMVCWKLLRGRETYTILQLVLCNMFLWTIILFSIFMKSRSSYYYYYTRYLAPYIGVILLCFAALYGDRRPAAPSGQRPALLLVVAVVAGMACLMPFSWVVIRNQDDTCMQWSEVTDILGQVQSQDVVYLDPEYTLTMYHILRAKGAAVYPLQGSLADTMEAAQIGAGQGREYCLTDHNYLSSETDEGTDDNANNVGTLSRQSSRSWFQLVYRNTSLAQEDDLSQDFLLTGMPLAISKRDTRIYVLSERQHVTQTVKATDDNSFARGFAGVNDAGYRWMNASEAIVTAYLAPGTYQLVIHAGDVIPFDQIRETAIRVTVYCNDAEAGILEFTKENQGLDVMLSLPQTMVNDGFNVIRFTADTTWSPSEFGSGDTSTYVFSVSSLEFVPKR